MRISAALIVKNEEACLARCLEAARGVADEIVVVDTGSTDGTVEVARQFTDCVHTFAWIDDFAAARNAALARATGDYVLVLDADETILEPAAARVQLERFVAMHTPDTVGTVTIVSAITQGPMPHEVQSEIARFFRRGAYRYEGRIHEQLVPVAGGALSLARTGVRCAHTGYDHAPDSPDHKALRNIPLLVALRDERPADHYVRVQLGRSYFTLNRFGEAVAAFEEALARMTFSEGQARDTATGAPVGEESLVTALTTLAYAYCNLGRTPEARTLLERHKALKSPAGFAADFHCALGYVYLMLGEVARSQEAYLGALRCGEETAMVLGTGSFNACYHMGLLSEAAHDLDSAQAWYVKALEAQPGYAPVIARAIDWVVEADQPLSVELYLATAPEAFAMTLSDKLSYWVGQGDHAKLSKLSAALEVLRAELERRAASIG